MRFLLLIPITILLSVPSFAYHGDTLWTRTYGGSGEDGAYSLQPTADGGYILAGYTNSFGAGDYDFYLLKIDENGDILWTRTYGGSGLDEAHSVQQTNDGGYVLAGRTNSFGAGGFDFYLVKTDENGDTLWTRTYGDVGCEEAQSIRQTFDGGYIVTGYTNSIGHGGFDCCLLKTDGNGDLLWARAYGDSLEDKAYSVLQTDNGDYVLAGYKDYNDFYVVKANDNGNTIWARRYLAGWWMAGSFHSIITNIQGGYALAGWWGNGGEGDFYLVIASENGYKLRTMYYGGNDDDRAYSIHQTADSGFVMAGFTNTYGAGDYDCYLVKTDDYGHQLWARYYGDAGCDKAYSMQIAADGDFLMAGYTESYGAGAGDVYLLKVEGQGPPVTVDMMPDNPPIVVNPGGYFYYHGTLRNYTYNHLRGDIWIMINVPGYGLYGPVDIMNNVRIEPVQVRIDTYNFQSVPLTAPLGVYDYIAYCGNYPDEIMDTASFQFTVVAPIIGSAGSWNLNGWFDDTEEALPTATRLYNNYPNPFNAVTTITYDLPAANSVRLEIYNLMGQKVETLVDGWIEGGQHTVTWDASQFSNGIYFYRLIAGDKVLTKRMTLLK
jgi:hypothetical protein